MAIRFVGASVTGILSQWSCRSLGTDQVTNTGGPGRTSHPIVAGLSRQISASATLVLYCVPCNERGPFTGEQSMPKRIKVSRESDSGRNQRFPVANPDGNPGNNLGRGGQT